MNFRRLPFLALVSLSPYQVTDAWQNREGKQWLEHGRPASSMRPRSQQSPTHSRKDFFVATTFTLAGSSFLFPLVSAAATAAQSSLSDEILQSLRPATAERPAISLSSPAIKDPTKPILPLPTTVSALVNLQNPQLRPSPGETLVIQVWTARPGDVIHRQGILLGGAKIPVSRIRFPVQIQLTIDNALSDRKESWKDVASRSDLYLTATVCAANGDWVESKNDATRPSICTNVTSSFEAMGVSKLLTELPGLEKASIPYGVRPPATLSLMSVGNRQESSGEK